MSIAIWIVLALVCFVFPSGQRKGYELRRLWPEGVRAS